MMRIRGTSKYIQVSYQLAMGLFVCTAVVIVTCLLWSSKASALTASSSACTSAASQQSAVINFFVHDDLEITPTGSAFLVVGALNKPNGVSNTNLFGSIAVIDDSVTVGPEVSSSEIARGRGFYIFDHLQNDSTSIEFVLTIIFNNQSDYEDGSTLVLRGYDDITQVYRELAVMGGTGTFRLARGWVGILTYSLNGGAAVLNMTANVFYGCNYNVVPLSGSSQLAPSYVTIFNIVVCTIGLPFFRRLFQ